MTGKLERSFRSTRVAQGLRFISTGISLSPAYPLKSWSTLYLRIYVFGGKLIPYPTTPSMVFAKTFCGKHGSSHSLMTFSFLNYNAVYLVIALFLDFPKAFDGVPYNLLLLKQSSVTIEVFVISWIHSLHSQRHEFFNTNHSLSSLLHVLSGVTQGTTIGTLLFLICINGLRILISSTVHSFADDCVIYRKIELKPI